MKAIHLPVFVLLPMLFCGCCNFASQEVNGVCSRAALEAYLPDRSPAEAERIRREAETSDVQLVFERGEYGGYKAKLLRWFSWNIPFGPYHERSFWNPDKERRVRSLSVEMDCWGTTILPFMTGIFMAGDAKVYDYPGGDCLAYERFMRAGIIPLIAYEASVMPASQGSPMPGCPSVMSPESLCRVSSSLDGVTQDRMDGCYAWSSSFFNQPKYERLTSYYFLCGLFAFGQKNERAYMQIAWIPIRLWSLEEEPTPLIFRR
jgi:hypothetical protein